MRHPWRAPLAVTLLIISTRLPLLWGFFDGWFYADETLAGCVEPAQFLLREHIWGGSWYVSYLAFLAGYTVLGFAPTVPRLVSLLFVAAAAGLFHAAVRRAIGARSAWIASVWFIVAAPFLLHALYALQLGLGLLPMAMLAWVLAGDSLGPWHGIVIGPVLVVALYVYPASFLACVSLLAVHAVLHGDRWRWSGRFAAGIALICGGAAAVVVRWRVTGAFDPTRWGGGTFSPADVPEGLRVLFADAFWRSTSFDSLNLGQPYLDPALQGLVLVGIAVGWRLRDAEWWGGRGAAPPRLGVEWRWAVTGALAFALALVLASLGGWYPGIRRAFPAFLLLGIPLARGVRETTRRVPRGMAAAIPVAAFAIVLWHTGHLVKTWPRFPEPDFVASARAILAADDMTGRDVIVIGEPNDLYGGEAWRCVFVLDEHLGPRLGHIVVVPRSELAGRRGLSAGRAVVLASAPLVPEELRVAFGRDPVRTIDRTPNGPRDFGRLGVVYIFDQDARVSSVGG